MWKRQTLQKISMAYLTIDSDSFNFNSDVSRTPFLLPGSSTDEDGEGIGKGLEEGR